MISIFRPDYLGLFRSVNHLFARMWSTAHLSRILIHVQWIFFAAQLTFGATTHLCPHYVIQTWWLWTTQFLQCDAVKGASDLTMGPSARGMNFFRPYLDFNSSFGRIYLFGNPPFQEKPGVSGHWPRNPPHSKSLMAIRARPSAALAPEVLQWGEVAIQSSLPLIFTFSHK